MLKREGVMSTILSHPVSWSRFGDGNCVYARLRSSAAIWGLSALIREASLPQIAKLVII
jgi:hypothetical protein